MCNNQPLQVTPDVLVNIIQGELNAIARYEQLGRMAAEPGDRQLLQGIHNDSINHVNAVADVYLQLTGTNPPVLQMQAFEVTSWRGELRAAMLEALRDGELYRCIWLDCDNPARNLFFDMMADETKHALILNSLIAGSLEECCRGEEVEPPAPPQCSGFLYTVQPGDGVWLIAQRYGVTVEELLAANPQVTDPQAIYVGQMLCVPCAGTAYVVQPGDSLWRIGQNFGLSVEEILSANPIITDPAALQVGQVVCVPQTGGGGGGGVVPVTERESLTYLYGATAENYLGQLADTRDSIRTVCPDFFELDESGNLLLASSIKLNEAFIAELHRQGLLVTPFISNHWNRQNGIAAMNNREQLTTQLASVIAQYNLDGVNFDIENVTEQQRAMYVDLVKRMREKLPQGKTVSVAVAANPNGWNTGWHGSYDYPELARYCDYLVIMAYDESYQGGPAGPVSSGAFFENSIRYALEQGVPKEKIVVGIPFFGRYWKDGEATGGIGLSDRDIEYLLSSYDAEARYDENTQSGYALVTIRPQDPPAPLWGGRTLGAGTYRIWYDNLTSTRHKLELINRYDLRGAGSWALGQENAAVWDFYTAALNGR